MKIENGLDNPSPIVYNQIAKLNDTSANTEKYSRGRRGAPAKGVGWATAARVQIPLSPPNKIRYPFWIPDFCSFVERKGDLNPKGAAGVKQNSPVRLFCRRLVRRRVPRALRSGRQAVSLQSRRIPLSPPNKNIEKFLLL